MSWQSRANCLDVSPGLFFPSSRSHDTNRRSATEAKRVCAGCQVSDECFTFALTSNNGRRETFGIFGGVDFEQFRRDHRTGIENASKRRRKQSVA